MSLNPDREAARRYADENGYFWLPCCRCGTWFGGHEALMHEGDSVQCVRDPNTFHMCCCKKTTDGPEAEACARGHEHDQ